MIKKVIWYTIGIILTAWFSYAVVCMAMLGYFPLQQIMLLLLSMVVIWHAHTIKVKRGEKT